MDKYTRNHDGRFASRGKAVSAEAAQEQKQSELAARTLALPPRTRPPKLPPIFSAYVLHLERTGRAKSTVDRNRASLIRLSQWFALQRVEPAAATELILEEYVSHLNRAVAETTASRETTNIKAAYRYAVRIGIVEKSPAEYLKPPKVTEVEPEVFSNEELRCIRAAIRDGLEETIFYALSYAGLRRCELVGLTWESVDLGAQLMTVRGKGSKLRRVPIHPVLAEVLFQHRRRTGGQQTVLGRGGSLRNVNQRIENLLQRAGVDGGNRPAHRFRKTVATVLFEERVQTDVIDRIMGWAPQSIRSRYYTRIPEAAMVEAVLRLYESDPIEAPPSQSITSSEAIPAAS
jgi:integrase